MTELLWRAAAVHLFTALGSVAALLAMLSVFDRNIDRMFLWLGVALFVDAIDGTFARMVRVKEVLPRFSGETLDLVVDFVTYVFVPVAALIVFSKFEGAFGLAIAAGALLSSLYHFADTESKDAQYRFVGFPALWNVVAFYVFAFDLTSASAELLSMACIVAAFVPMPWVHPLRVSAMRPLTLLVLAAGCAAALYAVAAGLPAGFWAKIILAIAAAYGIGQTAIWSLKR